MLKEGKPLDAKSRDIHDRGLVAVLKEHHEALDQAVAEAYGWPLDLDEESILERLVELNAERRQEEAEGRIRWLRPDFQNPEGHVQQTLVTGKSSRTSAAPNALQWPKTLTERLQAIQELLNAAEGPLDPETIAARFRRARRKQVVELLEALVHMGAVRKSAKGLYQA